MDVGNYSGQFRKSRTCPMCSFVSFEISSVTEEKLLCSFPLSLSNLFCVCVCVLKPDIHCICSRYYFLLSVILIECLSIILWLSETRLNYSVCPALSYCASSIKMPLLPSLKKKSTRSNSCSYMQICKKRGHALTEYLSLSGFACQQSTFIFRWEIVWNFRNWNVEGFQTELACHRWRDDRLIFRVYRIKLTWRQWICTHFALQSAYAKVKVHRN